MTARARYIALWLATVLLGLGIHLGGGGINAQIRDVLGDATWAAMMTWLVSAIVPGASPWTRSGVALAVCVAVELSQLLHTPGLDAVRGTTIGHLVLGSDFDSRDLAAYAGGVCIAALLDRWLRVGSKVA